jgi:hypothetical protein
MKGKKSRKIDWSKKSGDEKWAEVTRLRRLRWGNEIIDKGMDRTVGFVRRKSDGKIVRPLRAE